MMSLRISCLILLIAGLCGFAGASWQGTEAASSWPMFRGVPSLQGISSERLAVPLKLKWSFQAKDSIESSAAIVDGSVFFGSQDGGLYALDLASGKLRWRYDTNAAIGESSPCVYSGMVFVGDLNGILHAVDSVSGKPRWTFKTEGELKSSPVASGNRVYIGSYDQNLYCVSTAGALIWKYPTEGPVHCTPGIEGNRVYISGCDENFRAVDSTSGKQVFAVPLGGYTGASAALGGTFAYVGTFSNEVLAIDLRQHVIRWTYSHPSRKFPFYSSAALSGDKLVLGGRDKMVHCIHASTGRVAWTFLTKARVESSPLIAGNRVFVGSNDGILYELDLNSGKKNWEFTAGAPLSASPAVARGNLVIGSQDGVVYCFE